MDWVFERLAECAFDGLSVLLWFAALLMWWRHCTGRPTRELREHLLKTFVPAGPPGISAT